MVGFDDLPVAGWVSPPLTTVRQPLTDMADSATRLVLQLARGEAPAQTRLELATELITRGSTGRPPVVAGSSGADGRDGASGSAGG